VISGSRQDSVLTTYSPLYFLGRKWHTEIWDREVFQTMAEISRRLGAKKGSITLLALFIPSRDRLDTSIDQDFWVNESLNVLGLLFGGATAFPRGRGVWRDDAQGGILLFDEPVVIQCYTSAELLDQKTDELSEFLHRMGREARQGAIGLVIDRKYLEIEFPLDEPNTPPKRKTKRRK
jgi:hypothetical protein